MPPVGPVNCTENPNLPECKNETDPNPTDPNKPGEGGGEKEETSSNGWKIAVGILVPICIVLLFVVLYFCLYKKKCAKNETPEEKEEREA